MRPWDALSHVMGMSRRRRIGSREAEQLLTADPEASARPALSELLAAAAAPPRPDELVGLRAAMAAFEAAGQPDRTRIMVVSRRGRFARPLAVKLAAGVAVLLFGGTALAAEAGRLPDSTQRQAHDLFSGLGVPAPGARSTPAMPPVVPTATVPTPTPTPAPRPSTGDRSAVPVPAGAATRGLCRSWQARQQKPKQKPMKGEPLRRLAEAAGGEERIAAFCAALLTDDPGATATRSPAESSPTPSPPGQEKGKDKGKDNGKDKNKNKKG